MIQISRMYEYLGVIVIDSENRRYCHDSKCCFMEVKEAQTTGLWAKLLAKLPKWQVVSGWMPG
jgi:hypothetical protein